MRGKKTTSRSKSNANNSVNFSPIITVNGAPATAEEANPMLFDMLDSIRRENEALVQQLRLKGELMNYKDKEIARLQDEVTRLKNMLSMGFAS